MKKFESLFKKILVVIFISFISISFISISIYGGPSYNVDNLRIEAYINPDGSVNVNELVQYDAYEINGILYNIDYKGYGDLKNLRVFYEKDSEFVPAVNNSSQRRGTYSLKDRDDLREVKLYYPMRNTKKWFLFQYTLSQGVTVYNDICLLYTSYPDDGGQRTLCMGSYPRRKRIPRQRLDRYQDQRA